jgi:hypothetical protein
VQWLAFLLYVVWAQRPAVMAFISLCRQILEWCLKVGHDGFLHIPLFINHHIIWHCLLNCWLCHSVSHRWILW